MKIKQMFPSWRCDAQEFHELFPTGTVLTVRSVEARKDSSDEEYFTVYFDELKKPIGLNKTNAQAIADIARSDETDDWAGVQVKMLTMPVEYTDSSTKRRVITMGFRIFEKKPGEVPVLAAASDLTRLLEVKARGQLKAPPSRAAEPGIGFESAVGMMAHIEERGKTFDEVVAMAKLRQWDQHLTGDIPPSLKDSARKVVAAICKDFPKVKDVNKETLAARLRAVWYPPVSGEVIDTMSGEVLSPGVPELNPDDIPF